MNEDSSFGIGALLGLFVGSVIFLAVLAPQYIPLATNIFVFLLVDNVKGLVAGAIVVTTPQQVSLADSRRAVAMYKKLNIPTLGVVENMSYFVCRHCNQEADIFGHGGGEEMAATLGVPFLGRIPIYQPIREGGDNGVPLLISEPESPAGRAFMAAAEQAAAQVSIASYNRPTIPLTVVR